MSPAIASFWRWHQVVTQLSVPQAKRNEGDEEGSIYTGWSRQKSPRCREKNVVKCMEPDHSILELSWPLQRISSNSFILVAGVEDLRGEVTCLRTHSRLDAVADLFFFFIQDKLLFSLSLHSALTLLVIKKSQRSEN